MLAVFLDIETNGLDASLHRTLEVAFSIRNLSNKGLLEADYEALIRQPKEVWNYSDPRSLKINGFSFATMAGGKSEEEVAQEIKKLFADFGIKREKALFICQNPAFDRIFFAQLIDLVTQENLEYPYHWLDLGSMYFVKTIDVYRKNNSSFPTTFSLSKDKIAEHYNLPREQKPHRAMNGVTHLIECFEKVVGWP